VFKICDHGGHKFVVPDRDSPEVLGRRIAQCEYAVGHVLNLDTKRRVVVQAGANWGYWPLRFADIFETVYTFEPDHTCFASLVANTSQRTNVVRLQAALGDGPELVDLWRDVDTTGNQYVDGKGIYPTLRIDSLGLEVCDLIYLDIEGREFNALRGAENTIRFCRPVVILEARRKFDWGDRALTFLEALGYSEAGAIEKDVIMRPGAPA
jgi:FkbM family methyltransferase